MTQKKKVIKSRSAHKAGSKKNKSNVKSHILKGVVFVVLVAIAAFLILGLPKLGLNRADAAAKVNGEVITMDYLEEQYSRIPAEYQEFINKETLLNQSINEVLLLQEAKKLGIQATEKEVETEILNAMAQGNLNEEQLDEKLADQNLTRALLEELYTKQLTINKLLEAKVFNSITISEAAIEAYYNAQIHAMHILVESEDEAYNIIKKLNRVSKNSLQTKFGELAMANSIDPSAQQNKGDLGMFGQGQMVPEFEQEAFSLNEFEYSLAPVQTQFGYHVILRVPKDASLEESQNEIASVLSSQKKAEIVPNYIEKLRENSDIVILYKAEE